jgi:hypothetical protein
MPFREIDTGTLNVPASGRGGLLHNSDVPFWLNFAVTIASPNLQRVKRPRLKFLTPILLPCIETMSPPFTEPLEGKMEVITGSSKYVNITSSGDDAIDTKTLDCSRTKATETCPQNEERGATQRAEVSEIIVAGLSSFPKIQFIFR